MQWERHKGQEKRKQKSRKCNGKSTRNGKRGSKKHNKRAESVMWKKQEIEKTDGRIYDSGKG